MICADATRRRAARLLTGAAHHIDRYGWCQGEYWPGAMTPSPYVCHDCCCPLGALAIAAGIDDYAKAELALEHTPALRLAVAALAAQISDHPGDSGFSDRARRRRNLKEIVSWNDAAGRTAVEVTAALRAAAAHVVARR